MNLHNHVATSEARILVIGAGVAGCSIALRLRQLGINVDLAEKERFPRPKVCGCCIGHIGLEQLRRLGVLDAVVGRAVTTNCWLASLGGRQLRLQIPDGIAISREVLDSMMVEVAVKAGVRVLTLCKATIESMDGEAVAVRFDSTVSGQRANQTNKSYDCVVVASGLKAGSLKGLLPWIEEPHGPFGASFMAKSSDLEAGVIYMACDWDGYVGLVQLEGGQIDVAAALVSGSTSASQGDPLTRIKKILARSVLPTIRLESHTPMMTTPPLRRTRVAGRGRIIAIGDAAGYVEPFTGEGMTWAMQEGIHAADLIAAKLHNLEHIGDYWKDSVKACVKRRKTVCRVMTRMLRSTVACRIAGTVLKIFPGLARPFTEYRETLPSRS
jgi:flavin-dependent dehydrogenase